MKTNRARSLANNVNLKNIYCPKCGQTFKADSVLKPQMESVCCRLLGFCFALIVFKVGVNGKYLLLVLTDPK